VFDLAAISTPRELERAFHELEVRRLWGPVSVKALVDRYPGHRGVANLRALLGSRRPVGVTRNEFEERFVAVLDSEGLPRPRFNPTLHLRGRFFEPDALWEDQRLIASSTAAVPTRPTAPSTPTASATASCSPRATAPRVSPGISCGTNPPR
jgi:hypothetical protein